MVTGRGNGAARMVTIGVLALQGAVREHERMLDGLGVATRRVRVPSQLDGLDGLVLPGGESTAIARLARPSGLLTAIRDRIDAGFPVFGTCAGLILLADDVADPGGLVGLPTIGGLDVTVRRNAYGAQLASGEADVELSAGALVAAHDVGVALPRYEDRNGSVHPVGRDDRAVDEPSTMRGVFIRAPRIERVGAGVQVLGTREYEPVAIRSGAVFACTFHPEIVPDPALHALWLGGV